MTREEYAARRQAIVMDVLYGMTYAEAAREYGMTDATVRKAVKKELLRLRRHGWLIAKDNGADTNVIEYFSFLHDSRRFNEDSAPDHGKRAAEFALSLRDSYINGVRLN